MPARGSGDGFCCDLGGLLLGPRRDEAVHAGISHQLAHVLVGVHYDAEIHAINRRISVRNSDLTLKVFRVLR